MKLIEYMTKGEELNDVRLIYVTKFGEDEEQKSRSSVRERGRERERERERDPERERASLEVLETGANFFVSVSFLRITSDRRCTTL